MVNALGCEVRRIFISTRACRQKERGNKENKKRKKEKSLGSLKEKKKINKRKKGDRKTAPPYIFSSPKVEEKIPVEAGVRVCAERAYLSRSYVSGSL
ncbi:hypothetical protein [Bacteroides uniformis]|uniref:Uncharacterized protein n=1 Tax=Bacteroides uniformis TaxID=820 RepID=A0A6I0LMK2_BACUN|nr:hypothetical protein [Bacteroides uniformis]KAB4246621.1 hypothetical protein GAP49_18185 [Bacteroides uniformis]KAB4248359.1 hypothetical protein GAP48_18585 [Bacteroides uniformis]KAB4252386.1 hypothetical protein GAO04_09860 [Bacteroides uniformis]KAB4261336.1 hypothetical protein GAP40_09150 [Bacteroides uniformis]